MLIHIANFVGNTLQAAIPFVQSWLCASKYKEILRMLIEVDELFVNFLHVAIDYRRHTRNLLITNILPIIIYVFCSCYVSISAIHLNPNFAALTVYYFAPLVLAEIFLQWFCFTVQLLTIYFDAMREALGKSIKHREVAIYKEDCIWHSRGNYHKVVVLQKIYRLLWQCSILINECFGFGLVFIFASFIMRAVYRGFLLCCDVIKGNSSHRQYIAMVHIFSAIFIVHFHCERCSRSVIM